MDTLKMVTEIKTACSALETEKASLTARLKQVEEELSSYYIAVESLMKTVPKQKQEEREQNPETKKTWSRKTVYLEYNGERLSVPQWAERLGISSNSIRDRLKRGWSIEDTLTKKATDHYSMSKRKNAPSKVYMYDSHDNIVRQFTGVGDASRDLNLPASTVEKIIAKMTKDDQLRCRNYYLAYAG